MGYPTTAELIAGSSGEAREALDALDAAQQDALRSAAIAAVEEFCGQRFVSEQKTLNLSGGGGRELTLPQRLATLTSLTIAGTPISAGDVVLSDDKTRLAISRTWNRGWLMQAQYQFLGATIDGLVFTLGDSNIAVVGTWGWLDAEFPDAVAQALRIDIEDMALTDSNQLGGSIRAYRQLGVRDISQGRLSLSLRIGGQPLSQAVKALLRPYVWQASLGAVA